MDEEDSLVILEDIEEISNGKPGSSGPLTLFKQGRRFGISWVSNPENRISAIFDPVPAHDQWERFSSFRLYLDDIGGVSFQDSPPFMVLSVKDGGHPRVFRAKEHHFFAYAILIEQLLLHGVAVITGNCNIEFSRDLVPRDFVLPPIELQSNSFENFDQFWEAVSHFADEAYCYFDCKNLLGPDSLPSIALSARASYASLLNQIANHFASIPPPPPITDWNAQFTPEGRLVDIIALKNSLYFNGIEPTFLVEALPFIFGVFPSDSTSEERRGLEERMTAEFELLSKQLELQTQAQREHDRRLMGRFRTIDVDCPRIVKIHSLFEKPESEGSVAIERLLKVHCLYQPRCYHQGMTDLLQPILLAFLITSSPSLVLAFFCFNGLLRKTKHIQFLDDVGTSCKLIAIRTSAILKKVAPITWIWLKRAGLKKLMWMHTDMALMYKRSFPNVWDFWLQIYCSPDPENWLAYMTCAIVLLSLNSLLDLGDLGLASLTEEFPPILRAISVDDVRRLSWWLYRMAPPGPSEPADEADIPMETEFFAAV
jgi:hypothetical protein